MENNRTFEREDFDIEAVLATPMSNAELNRLPPPLQRSFAMHLKSAECSKSLLDLITIQEREYKMVKNRLAVLEIVLIGGVVLEIILKCGGVIE